MTLRLCAGLDALLPLISSDPSVAQASLVSVVGARQHRQQPWDALVVVVPATWQHGRNPSR